MTGITKPSVALASVVLVVAVFGFHAKALPPFAILPDVPEYVDSNADIANLRVFVDLWKQTLEKDGQGDAPTRRINFEPKTIVAPSDAEMANIIPQDIENPLYIANETFADLRREFLLDHILLDPVDLEDSRLDTPEGLRMMTFSGKDLIFKFDEKLGLVAGGVRVKSAMSLQDATRMLTTEGPLFDSAERVNRALDVVDGLSPRFSDLDTPTGPPLDLEVSLPQPPAPPSREQIIAAATAEPPRAISPPALPPGVSPPAPPPAGSLKNVDQDLVLTSALLSQPLEPMPPSAAFHRPAALNAHDLATFAASPPAPPPLPSSPPTSGKVSETSRKGPQGPSPRRRR